MPQVNTHPPPSNIFSGDEERDNDIFASDELMFASPAKKWYYPPAPHLQPIPHIPPQTHAWRLSPGILINILKYLSSPSDIHNALLVSRSWCECSVELLWYRPSIPDFNALIKITQVISCEEPTFDYAQFIRRLNFASLGSDMSDSHFSRLAPCKRLERLTLVGCWNLSDDVIARTVPCFPNLISIDLSGVECIAHRTVYALAESCCKLQGANLQGCERVTSNDLCALADLCSLRRIRLNGLVDLTDEPVSAIAKKCSLLIEIDLTGCKKISDRAVRDIWTHAHNMRELRLSHCAELTSLAFPAPQNIRDLPPGPNSLPQSADSTRLLTSDHPPLHISRLLKNLRTLDLTSCSNITDDAIEGIVAAAPRLRSLVLSKCSQLTDRAVESISLLRKHLHSLQLSNANFITDESIKTLSQSCTRLRYIDLENCNQLTDLSVFELANLPKLMRIGLVGLSNLTDEAINSLGVTHQTLERVHLSYCDQITLLAIHGLLKRLPRLTHLTLTGNSAFLGPEIQQFGRPPPAEFNEAQRSTFRVFNGQRVNTLRQYLVDLHNVEERTLVISVG